MNYTRQARLLVYSLFFGLASAAQPQTAKTWQHEGAYKLWLSRDGSTLLSQSRDTKQMIRVWNVSAQKFVGSLPLSNGQYGNVLALSQDGRTCVVRRKTYNGDAAEATMVRCEAWALRANGASPRLLWKFSSRNQEQVLAATFQGTNVVLLWPTRVETRNSLGRAVRNMKLQVEKDESQMEGGGLSTNGQLAVLGRNSRAYVFNTSNGKKIRKLELDDDYEFFGWWRDITFSYDGRFVTGVTDHVTDPGLSEDVHSQIVSDRWVWDVWTEKMLLHWPDIGDFRSTFSPDGRAILKQTDVWNWSNPQAPTFEGKLQFQNIVSHKPSRFQIPHPWNKTDNRWLLDVRVSGDGKTVVALDTKGNIWTQRPK